MAVLAVLVVRTANAATLLAFFHKDVGERG